MGNIKKDKLFSIAESQQGHFTWKQAKECGYLPQNIHRYVRSGEWIKEMNGIYRFAYYPLFGQPELTLWSLWSRNKQGSPQGVWSHETALDIHDLTDVMPAKMHMTVPKKFRRWNEIPPILVLHYEDLSDSHVETKDGFLVTTPLKTLIDVLNTKRISDDQITLGLQQGIERGLFTKHEMTSDKASKMLLKYLL